MRIGVHRDRDLRVSKDLHHDSRWYALSEKEGGARVPQIMEPTLDQAGSVKNAVELMSDNRAVEWLAIGPRKDQAQFVPGSIGRPFPSLPVTMLNQSAGDDRGHNDR